MTQTQLNRLLMAVVALNLCFLIGCHRSYYRRQADAEAGRLVREKAVDPRWDSVDGSIAIDPQSRMFNPFSQDHPPIPPDDQASHQFMHEVDCKGGLPPLARPMGIPMPSKTPTGKPICRSTKMARSC